MLRTALYPILVAMLPGLAQDPPSRLPFGPGESLSYVAKLPALGRIGEGTLSVERLDTLRQREALLLRFDFAGRVALMRVEDRTRSWLDGGRMASLRYEKREKSPLGSRTESVDVFPEERRWAAEAGNGGSSPTAVPLDELSFLYYLRTLPLADGESYVFERHFDSVRNPIRVQVLGRDRIDVPAGRFAVVEVEMRVRDPLRFGGEGVMRLALTDDARRLPVRIETSLPVAGKVVLDLTGYTGGRLAAQ